MKRLATLLVFIFISFSACTYPESGNADVVLIFKTPDGKPIQNARVTLTWEGNLVETYAKCDYRFDILEERVSSDPDFAPWHVTTGSTFNGKTDAEGTARIQCDSAETYTVLLFKGIRIYNLKEIRSKADGTYDFIVTLEPETNPEKK